MVSVAQKTLFSKFLTILAIFFLNISISFATNIYKTENLTYKVSLNGFNLGEAVISYQPNKEKGSYKIFAAAKTKGFAKNFYKIDTTIMANGFIRANQLQPISQTSVVKKSSKNSNKTVLFDYSKDLLTIKDNSKATSATFVLLNKAKDLFSELYTLRFNTDLVAIKEKQTIKSTAQLTSKTLHIDVDISAPFSFDISKANQIKVNNVVVTSKREKYHALKDSDLALIEQGKKKSSIFIASTKYNRNYKPEENIKIIVSADDKKIPLIINYVTKMGTFKAVLIKAK